MALKWLSQLDAFLGSRQVAQGFDHLNRHSWMITSLRSGQADASAVVVRLAQWVDLGYRDAALLKSLVDLFTPNLRASLHIRDFLELRMAEAFCAMDEEDIDRAIALLDFVLRAEPELGDRRLAAIAHFWKGRSHRKKGEYDEAIKHVVRGRELMQEIHMPKLAAVIQIQESWLLFQKGKPGEAVEVLDEAEKHLADTDDNLSLGNIESARGRMEQQAGKYTEALAHFDAAVELYGRRDPNHRNLARALVNAVTVKRLIALQLRKRIDARAEQGAGAQRSGSAGDMARYNQMCSEALAQLDRAGEIYVRQQYYGGIAAVLVSSGYLHLDGGNIELGAREGQKAYELAHDKNDHIHMARARTLQCMVENTRVDEQLGEDADVAVCASQARQFAEEAIHWAELTQNRRLIAEAYVARGMVYGNDFFLDWEGAKRCVDQAVALIGPEERDHLWEDLMALKARILRASSIDETLRAWSEGILGEKTFQQITEEFAEIVIPKVWQREGKKVSRVSSRLAISPKKVRRILRNVGLVK
ncbi:MAG TPA: tetratricopeptide repeat protein [Terriglobales bacterium]